MKNVANVDGKLYGSKALTMVVIAFLFVVVPYVTSGAINVAYNSGDKTTKAFPESGSNYSDSVTYHTWENGSLNPPIPTQPTWSRDCLPYDHLTSTVGQYPAAPYQLNYLNYGLVHNQGLPSAYVENVTFRNMGSPFIKQANFHSAVPSHNCRTTNDTIGVRLDPATTLLEGGLGKTMIRFNATILIPDITPVLNALSIDEAEFDWWIEIDGVRMFGEDVRLGDTDAEIDAIDFWAYAGASLSISPYPFPHHLRLDHTLNPTEERLMRDALHDANLSNVNLSLFLTCHASGQTATIYEPCAFIEDSTSSGGVSGDWYIHAESEWIYADDYDFIIQGTAFVLSLISLVIAVASTPLWNPLASRLKGDV